MNIKKRHILMILLAMCVCAIVFRARLQRPVVTTIQMLKGKKTVADRVAQFGGVVRKRLSPIFDQVGVAYPPQRMTLVGLKAEQMLQVWVSGTSGKWRHLRDYPILGVSGTLGPKLKEGDMQVPEGLYRVESLNPNSLYHLAIRVNYPNAEDRQRGQQDERTELGSDIMIHGKTCSIGCLAMGDEAAEDLFILVAETGIDKVSIILSPIDFRIHSLPKKRPSTPVWTEQLYDSIRQALNKLEPPPPTECGCSPKRKPMEALGMKDHKALQAVLLILVAGCAQPAVNLPPVEQFPLAAKVTEYSRLPSSRPDLQVLPQNYDWELGESPDNQVQSASNTVESSKMAPPMSMRELICEGDPDESQILRLEKAAAQQREQESRDAEGFWELVAIILDMTVNH